MSVLVTYLGLIMRGLLCRFGINNKYASLHVVSRDGNSMEATTELLLRISYYDICFDPLQPVWH